MTAAQAMRLRSGEELDGRIVRGDQVEQVTCNVELGPHFLRGRFWRYAPCLADRPRYGVGLMLVSRLKFHE